MLEAGVDRVCVDLHLVELADIAQLDIFRVKGQFVDVL